jgi:hypothetical protein
MSRPLLRASCALFFVLVLFSLAAGGCSGDRSAASASAAAPASGKTVAPAVDRPPASSATSAASARGALTAQERRTLVGRWLRYDQTYMIVIESVGEDGRLAAQYLNPDPVGVSKAEAWKAGGRVELLLELTDANYPGNFYELSYDPERQWLVGVYHHLGAREDYEVYFTRFEDEAPEAARPR